MNNYIIFTDSGCDLSEDILNSWNIKYCSLSFAFDDSEQVYYNYDLSDKAFYQKMRSGSVAKTSGVNTEQFKNAFLEELKNGNDILYLGFSSGLSVTYNCAHNAADELRPQFPERKIITIDTLSASGGLGLLIYLAKNKRDEGYDIDAVAEYIRKISPNVCHWYTVDDLVYLKRGGRVSPTVAVIGSVLGIKPVMHMNDKGCLTNVSKARGRKLALKALADKYGELSVNPSDGTVFISHGDCVEDAETVAEMIESNYGARTELITSIGPVIGAHAGPGTIALFFIGKER